MAAISGADLTGPVIRAAARKGEWRLLAGAALLMSWPALYNGFPLIFSDTGTYISQAMELHLGWDRPPFYSFLILTLGWGRTLWPPVIAQCLVASWLIRTIQQMVEPDSGEAGGAVLLGVLGTVSALPWTASWIMPDIFTPLMVLAFGILVLKPYCDGAERIGLIVVIGLAIMVHLSNFPLYCGLCLTVLPACALWRRPVRWVALLSPLAVGVIALSGVNLIASGQVSPSPYGATFVLARMMADGPAQDTLLRDCGSTHWALCRYENVMPRTADGFLWRADSPLYRAGGPKRLIDQTEAIVWRTVRAEPGRVLHDAGVDFVRQMMSFAPGSGLLPWRSTASRTIERDLARSAVERFIASRQARGILHAPLWLIVLDQGLAAFGIVMTAGYIVVIAISAAWRRRRFGGWQGSEPRLVGLCAIVTLALVGNAAVTGMLSGPHDRYQSRVVWLAVLSGLLVMQRVYVVLRSRPTRMTT